MRYLALLIAIFCCITATSNAQTLEDVWNKYSPDSQQKATAPPVSVGATLQGKTNDNDTDAASQSKLFPGRLIGNPQGIKEAAFTYPWKYRHQTYELHYENPQSLARSVYGLALFTGDISEDLPKEKFFSSVRGFHYSAWQVTKWLNHIKGNNNTLTDEEKLLIEFLIEDKFVVLKENTFSPGIVAGHLVAAAPGSTRSFDYNLRHERLHVYWDEDIHFQANFRAKWILLSSSEKDKEREKLKNYNQSKEQQLIEEWAVKKSETEKLSRIKE